VARIAPYGVVCQIKTEVHRAGKPKETADLKRLIGILRAGSFHGYVALEYEAAENPQTAVPRALAQLHELIDGQR
jgi:hypothetical protein